MLLLRKLDEFPVGFKGDGREPVKGKIAQFLHVIASPGLSADAGDPVAENNDPAIVPAVMVETTEN